MSGRPAHGSSDSLDRMGLAPGQSGRIGSGSELETLGRRAELAGQQGHHGLGQGMHRRGTGSGTEDDIFSAVGGIEMDAEHRSASYGHGEGAAAAYMLLCLQATLACLPSWSSRMHVEELSKRLMKAIKALVMQGQHCPCMILSAKDILVPQYQPICESIVFSLTSKRMCAADRAGRAAPGGQPQLAGHRGLAADAGGRAAARARDAHAGRQKRQRARGRCRVQAAV